MASTNVVNLDALIRRADLAMPGEASEDIPALSILGLDIKGFLYPALCKPDFQRETANWSPEQVSDLITTFLRRDLVPAVILWRAGQDVFVIDGAHRLSALVAWVHNDYGDGDVSRRFFHNIIPEDQQKAADKARQLINASVGSYNDHKLAIEYPHNSRRDIADRAGRLGWQEIPAQWIRNSDHGRAEKSFFRINQGGTKIDATEARILNARRSAVALAARAVLRAGTGHNYWGAFSAETQNKIEELGGEIYRLLFQPNLDLPIKTLDIPLAGQGYGAHVLPFLFDLLNLAADTGAADSSRKKEGKDEPPPDDVDGSATINVLNVTRIVVRRICSNHASSLGLHPALYFYTPSGIFQPTSMLTMVALIKRWSTHDYLNFISIRERFESFLLAHRGITEAVRHLGSGSRSRPRIMALYQKMISGFLAGDTIEKMHKDLVASTDFSMLFMDEARPVADTPKRAAKFPRDVKGAAFLRAALASGPKCPTCSGLLHQNGMQTGHIIHRRDGGSGTMENAMMQHPICNSTVSQ